MPGRVSNGARGKEDAGNTSPSFPAPDFATVEDEAIQSPTHDEESESLRPQHLHANIKLTSDSFHNPLDPIPTPAELAADHKACKDCISSDLDPKSTNSECLGCRKVLFDGFVKEIAAEQQQRKGNDTTSHHALQVASSKKPKSRLFATARVTDFLSARENLWNPRAIDQPQNVSSNTALARGTAQASTTQYVSNKTEVARLTPQTSSAVYKEIYMFAQTHKWCAMSEDRWTRLFERIAVHVIASQAGERRAPGRVRYGWLVEGERGVARPGC